MKKLYLYLASRSKQGIKLITTLQSESIVTSKLENLDTLDLPVAWKTKIERIIYDNRMFYEPIIETAKNFNELKSRLKHRGYSNIPMGAQPMLDFKNYKQIPIANTSKCQICKTMIRKRKSH